MVPAADYLIRPVLLASSVLGLAEGHRTGWVASCSQELHVN